jgi:hypothetical protein
MNALDAPSGVERPNGEAPPDSRKSGASIESLIERLGQVADPETLASAQALVRAILDLHASGLARILEIVGAASRDGALVETLGNDDLVANLLLLHGLHPLSLEARVRLAVGRISASGWALALLDTDEGRVRIGVTRTGDAKRAVAADRVRSLIEQAIEQAAPDAEALTLIGQLEDEPRAVFIPLERLRTPGPAAHGKLP